MEKSRLFICGDSWADYGNPPHHQRWLGYLEEHYDVYKFGKADMDNISIIYQTGQLPTYKDGDRLVVIFTDPTRYFRRYLVDEVKGSCMWYDCLKRRSTDTTELNYQKIIDDDLWTRGFRNDEISFYKLFKNLLFQYNPLFITWNSAFHKETDDFVDLIEVSSFIDEGLDDNDLHPGIVGNYEFYLQILKKLDYTITPIDFRGDKQII